jgi:hypothetical protein
VAGSTPKTTAARNYYLIKETAVVVVARFKVLFPDEYAKYKEYFDAGVWMKEDPGPFLARSIVYKLQTFTHRDDNDAGPTATFPAGYYKGGSMSFPDLYSKFA